MLRICISGLIFFVTIGNPLFAQTSMDYINYGKESIPILKELLAIPNDAHYPEDIEKNVQWCEKNFEKRGFDTKRLETETVPLLLAERRIENVNAKTVLIYLQLDGQPVDPNFWYQDNPYQAVLKQSSADGGWEIIDWNKVNSQDMNLDWRIFARSTADSKGAVMTFITAIDMMLDQNIEPNFHIKVIMDFEEELGSPHLPDAVVQYRKDLKADMLVIFDGPRHMVNEPTLTFGARGICDVTLKVFGPYFPQHSGHYGNYVPNPAVRLSKLISSMKDDYGRVTIPNFYEGIEISEDVKKILRGVPDDENKIKVKMGIAAPDQVAPNYQESLQYPSLNVRGMLSGWVGEAKRTIIPSSATAELDIRLVLESDPIRLINLVRSHIESEGYFVIDRKPTSRERSKYDRICQFKARVSYLAFRTDFDSDVGIWLERALSKAFGKKPIQQRTSGGSIPISPFVNELGIPAVTVPTVNRDNNQHSPNENLRLGNYFDGIKTVYAILTEPLD